MVRDLTVPFPSLGPKGGRESGGVNALKAFIGYQVISKNLPTDKVPVVHGRRGPPLSAPCVAGSSFT